MAWRPVKDDTGRTDEITEDKTYKKYGKTLMVVLPPVLVQTAPNIIYHRQLGGHVWRTSRCHTSLMPPPFANSRCPQIIHPGEYYLDIRSWGPRRDTILGVYSLDPLTMTSLHNFWFLNFFDNLFQVNTAVFFGTRHFFKNILFLDGNWGYFDIWGAAKGVHLFNLDII